VTDQSKAVGDRLELVSRHQPFVAEPLGEQPPDDGHERGPAGQEHLSLLARGDAGLAEHLVDGGAEPGDIVGNPGFEVLPCDGRANGGEYVELIPGERLRYTDKFDDPNLPGELLVTVTLKKVSVGTELDITQAGIPDVIPPEACYLGWQESLRNLARLVEPEINQ
jgi:Activator of Hsp90 ATPase homolog 1-like protein